MSGVAPEPFARLWAEARCALGAIAPIPAVQAIEVLARSGLDFVFTDIEHGPIGPAEAQAMIAATAGTPLVPLVPVVAMSAAQAIAPLDLGAVGVCRPRAAPRPTGSARLVPSARKCCERLGALAWFDMQHVVKGQRRVRPRLS